MFINDNLKQATIEVANLATGGAIGTAATTVDIASSFNITQTTAGQTITIPNPTDTLAGDLVTIRNTGTASFTILAQVLSAGEFATFSWSGTTWAYHGDTRNSGAVVTLASVVVGPNTVTHNLSLPTGSFSRYMFDAYNAAGNAVVFRRTIPTVDTANTLSVTSTVALSNITFYITPLA